MSAKSIAIISSEYFPLKAAGASRMVPLAEELLNAGQEVKVYSSRSVGKNNPLVVRSLFPTPKNSSKLWFRFLQEVLLGTDLGIRLCFRRNKIGLCIITSPPFFMACICAGFARCLQLPSLFDVRDRYPNVLLDLKVLNSNQLIFRFLKFLEFSVYKHASRVTLVTKARLRELSNTYKKPNLVLLENGFDEAIFTEKRLKNSKLECFTVVYHGRLGRFYDPNLYLEIMKKVYSLDPSIQFILVGEFQNSLDLERIENLRISPPMSLEELSEFLPKCHVGLCVLRELEAMKKVFPAKAYDYIGAGLPILAGPDGEMCETVRSLHLGVTFDQTNPEMIAKKIVELKTDNLLWTKLSLAVKSNRSQFGRRKILKDFLKKEHHLLGN